MRRIRFTVLAAMVLVMVLLLSSCGLAGRNQPGDDKSRLVHKEVKLYFSDQDGYLEVEKRTVEAETKSGIPEATIKALINGPKGSELSRTLPTGTELLDLNIKDGIARANFSEELQVNHWGGSLGESLTVYSIVNTLTQFDEINAVEILINGKKIESLVGHLDLTRPVAPNESIVRE